MNISEPFIRRPIGTSLLSLGILLLGLAAYWFLPVAPLPRVEFPTVMVSAGLPGADPSTMAATVAAPLERRLGQIAGVTEMTSVSSVGNVTINLQFDLDRKIDGAVKDVQSSLSAARGDLPPNLPFPPSFRKMNPADSPILILSLTSEYFSLGELYDFADNIVAQRVSQVEGVSMAGIYGGAKSAVRIRVNPGALAAAGLNLEDVRTRISQSNTYSPKGSIDGDFSNYTIESNSALRTASDYQAVVVAQKKDSAIRLEDLGAAFESVENTRMSGLSGTKPAILISVHKQSDANVIETVDAIKGLLPQLKRWLPAAVQLRVESDRTKTIRASVEEVQHALILSVVLVVLVMFLFLRRLAPTLIAAATVPLALFGTFGVMYWFGYSLDNLSLMALSISVGFVVDDAIVVIENIFRFIEEGCSPMEAALKGAKQIGFTVVSITISLVAVFIPILFMGGLIGRILQEFSVTLSVAVVLSAVVSLSLTPSLCARFLCTRVESQRVARWSRAVEAGLEWVIGLYGRILSVCLRNPYPVLLMTLGTIAATIWLYGQVPKGFFPQQDTGMVIGIVEASQDSSFASIEKIQEWIVRTVVEDPGVDTVVSYFGGGSTARMFLALKPRKEREGDAEKVLSRLRKSVSQVPGVRVMFSAMQDIRLGARSSKAQYQYSLECSDLDELNAWAPKVVAELRKLPVLRDVIGDQQTGGLKSSVEVDRDAASKLGVTMSDVDAAIYNAFGQRQISTIYRRYNQNRVILELDENHLGDPASLEKVFLRSGKGALVPLSSVAKFKKGNALLSVNHQGQFASMTVYFNLASGVSLGDATQMVRTTVENMQLPQSIRGSFQGTAKAFEASLSTLPRLSLWALVAVYLVLGILYESLIHPLTIISTLPSAGLGALLSLIYLGYDLSIVSFIGIILLMGIVKKNAIMMVDYAIDLERETGATPLDAIYRACVVRFRPIVMTTLAAIFGSLPLAFGNGVGSELRQPLGVAVVGGLVVSQILTLFSTPIVYLLLERLRIRFRRVFDKSYRVGDMAPLISAERAVRR